MDANIKNLLDEIARDKPYKIVLSNPSGKEAKYTKAVITEKESYYQIERFTDTQVFHENISPDSLAAHVAAILPESFRQLNSWSGRHEYSIKVTKKDKVLFNRKNISNSDRPNSPDKTHNRQKRYILPEGTVVPPLIDMGIMTREGAVVSSMNSKYRQINRFLEIIDDAFKTEPQKPLKIIDFGCGKSYLTFVLYYYFTKIKGFDAYITGLDLKSDVIEACGAAARKYGYDKLTFERGDIRNYTPNGSVDMVITLHACDTATDYALYNAIQWRAPLIFCAPCCQHELESQIKTTELSVLTKYGIIKERTAALLTDAVRGSLLEYAGYKTQLLEFVGFEHTPKNIMIRAVKKPLPQEKRERALAEAVSALSAFGASHTLLKLLRPEC